MIPKSHEIRIEVTTKCNYNCIICPRDQLTRNIEVMSFDLFKYIFDKINSETDQYKTLTFPGMGEPLLDKTLDDKIIYAKKRNFTVLLLTNGSLLTTNRFKRLEDIGVDSIRVSMYGNSPESYSAVHGTGKVDLFHRVKNNLTEISKIKKVSKLLLTYNMVDKYNSLTLDSWIEYWRNKVDLLEVWRPHNWVNSKNFRVVQEEQLTTCGRPFNTPLQVQVDGTVNMCCFDFDGKLLLGDLKAKKLSEIFESPMYKKIVEHHTTGDFKGSGLICESCDQRNANKSDIMIYSSRFDITERVKKVSTTYQDILQ